MIQPIPILLFHSVSDGSDPKFLRWVVSPEQFDRQMRLLHDRGYHPLTVTQLAQALAGEGGALPDRPVVVTFDDGYADFSTGAFPILKVLGFPATLYIVTRFAGRTSAWLYRDGEASRPMLDWGQIRGLQEAGIEIGSHSHTHPQLDTLPRTAAAQEIEHSKTVLEDHLGVPVQSFSYPHGYYSPMVRSLVVKAGYSSACGVKHAMSSTGDDPYGLARLIVEHDLSDEDFIRLIDGQGVSMAPRGETFQRRGWRVVRRIMQTFEKDRVETGAG